MWRLASKHGARWPPPEAYLTHMLIHSNDSHQVSGRWEEGLALGRMGLSWSERRRWHRCKTFGWLRCGLCYLFILSCPTLNDADMEIHFGRERRTWWNIWPLDCHIRGWMIFLPLEWQKIWTMRLSWSDLSAQVKCLIVSFVISGVAQGRAFVLRLISISAAPPLNLPTAVWLRNVHFPLWVCVCMGGWLEGLPAPDEKTPFSMAEVLLKAPRTNLCACERKSRHLQLKVNNANSIGHGLHGGKIKTFFFFFFH